MKKRVLVLLTTGHLVTDISQGAIPALLPFLIVAYNLSYADAGGLIMAVTVSSSMMQPLFGYLADRISQPWLIAIGPLVAGIGIALTGFVTSYFFIWVAFFICGLGIAAFHPEAALFVNRVSGDRKASGMSIFQLGGYAGYALGPLLITGLSLRWGLRGTSFFFFAGLAMAYVYFRQTTLFFGVGKKEIDMNNIDTRHQGLPKEGWLPFALLTGAIICRSVAFSGLNIFIPLYWIDAFHQSKAIANGALTLFFGIGLIGNLFGGRMADKYGCQKTVLISFIALVPLLLLFAYVKDLMILTIVLAGIGFAISTSVSPMVIMGQQYLPGRVGFSSGITIGLAVSVGGFAAPFLGMIADQSGINMVFYVLILFIVGAMTLAGYLFNHERKYHMELL